MLTRTHRKISLAVAILFLCLAQGVLAQRTPAPTPRPAPRRTFDLQIEVTTGNPAEKVEGAKVIVVSEESGVRFNKDKRTGRQGIASFSRVPQGKLRIQVIARECDTFGEIFTLTHDGQTIKITVRKRNQPTVSPTGIL